MVKDLSEKALRELIDQALLDEAIPTYARTLIQILAQQQEILQKEHRVLKRILGSKYERALKKMEEDDSGFDFLTWMMILMIFFFIIYIIRNWIKGAQFNEKVKATGKVAIVTGANCGIGKQIVRELVHRGAKVYIMCRNVELGKEAVRDLFSRYGCDSTRMIVKYGDLNDFDSIRNFVKEFNKEEDKLDILINNAGVMFRPKFELTVDKHEVTWQSNHLGHFLLTELLLPKLRKSEGARIVILSSKLHLNADTVDPDVVDSKKHWGRISSYNRSKLANVLHAVALTKRLREHDPTTKVTVNACHPGVVNTSLMRHTPFAWEPIRKVISPILWFFFKTDNDGAQTPLYLALSKKIDGISGKYFGDCKEKSVHPLATDNNACEALYNYSIEACGLDKSAID